MQATELSQLPRFDIRLFQALIKEKSLSETLHKILQSAAYQAYKELTG